MSRHHGGMFLDASADVTVSLRLLDSLMNVSCNVSLLKIYVGRHRQFDADS